MYTFFQTVEYRNDMGLNPASVRRSTGELFLNKTVFLQLAFEERIWILLHELGHLKGNTTNEFEADELAFNWYVSKGYSLKAAVKALTRLMRQYAQQTGKENQEHIARAKMQLVRVLEYDWQKNKYQPAKILLDSLTK